MDLVTVFIDYLLLAMGQEQLTRNELIAIGDDFIVIHRQIWFEPLTTVKYRFALTDNPSKMDAMSSCTVNQYSSQSGTGFKVRNSVQQISIYYMVRNGTFCLSYEIFGNYLNSNNSLSGTELRLCSNILPIGKPIITVDMQKRTDQKIERCKKIRG